MAFWQPLCLYRLCRSTTESLGSDTQEGEFNGPVEQHLPEREWAALSRRKSFLRMLKKEEV